MRILTDADERARANVGRSIDAVRHLPQNVFLGSWKAFFFFDSDWMFSREFVGIVKNLLHKEGSSAACLTDFESNMPELSSFWFRKETTSDAFLSARAQIPAEGLDGWLDALSRFGCTSDVGEWCFYCERRDEIAVMAFRQSFLVEKYRPAIEQLTAVPIDIALTSPPSWGFDHIPTGWREEFLKNYRNESPPSAS